MTDFEIDRTNTRGPRARPFVVLAVSALAVVGAYVAIGPASSSGDGGSAETESGASQSSEASPETTPQVTLPPREDDTDSSGALAELIVAELPQARLTVLRASSQAIGESQSEGVELKSDQGKLLSVVTAQSNGQELEVPAVELYRQISVPGDVQALVRENQTMNQVVVIDNTTGNMVTFIAQPELGIEPSDIAGVGVKALALIE